MEMRALAQRHKRVRSELADLPDEHLLLMYADLGLEVDEEDTWVGYHCPKCGTPVRMELEPFLHIYERFEARCTACWGDPGEHGGK